MIKRLLVLIGLVFVLVISNTNLSKADDIPTTRPACSEDCLDDNYWLYGEKTIYGFYPEPDGTGSTSPCPGCNIKVTYKYNPICKTLYITNFQFLTADCGNCLDNNTTKIWHVMKFLFNKMLLEGPLMPPNPGTSVIVKYRTSACWKDLAYPYNFTSNGIKETACSDEPCCKQVYTLRNNFPYPNSAEFLSVTPEGPCPQPLVCHQTCSPGVREDYYPLKIGINQNDGEIKLISYVTFPNPTPGSLKIEINSEINDILTIDVYDLKGNLVKQFSFNKKSSKIECDLNLSGLNVGMYSYNINLGENIKSSGKILIEK